MKKLSAIEIDTNVELRKATPKDAGALASMCADIDRTYLVDEKYFPDNLENAIDWIKFGIEYEGCGELRRLIYENDILIGYIGVSKDIGVRKRDSNIGYILRTEYWNQGIMTQAVKEICRLAFETMYIVRISGVCLAPNTGSRRVLEKAGFQLEGHIRKALIKNDKYYDTLHYGLMREDTGIQMPE